MQRHFELPQVGGLPDKEAALRERGKEVTIMLHKVAEEVFIGLLFEVFATDFHRENLDIAQCRRESSVANAVEGT